MINDTLNTIPKLQRALKVAETYVSAHPKDTPYQNFENRSPSKTLLLLWLNCDNKESKYI